MPGSQLLNTEQRDGMIEEIRFQTRWQGLHLGIEKATGSDEWGLPLLFIYFYFFWGGASSFKTMRSKGLSGGKGVCIYIGTWVGG